MLNTTASSAAASAAISFDGSVELTAVDAVSVDAVAVSFDGSIELTAVDVNDVSVDAAFAAS